MSGSNSPKAFTRSVRHRELPKVADLCSRALQHDPVLNWAQELSSPLTAWDSATKPSRETVHRHKLILAALRTAWIIGLVEVVVIPGLQKGGDTIVAVAIWLPPRQRLKGSSIITLLRAGFINVGLQVGWGTVKRVRSAFGPRWERHANTHCVAHGLTSYRATWSLQMLCTEPGDEGKGYMSLLMRSRLIKKPAAAQIVQATTPQARDYFEHFGFETVKTTWFGGGSVSDDGLPAVGARAVGVPVWILAKWV